MDILKKIILLASPLLLTGCYQDFEPKIDTKPVLCLNSLITAGEPIYVKVTHTWVFTDSEATKNHAVDDAELQIYANDILVDSDYIPQEGDEIHIVAHSIKYGKAEAKVTVPVATQIPTIDFTPKVKDLWMTQTPGWGTNASIEFDINIALNLADNPKIDNFFRLIYTSYENYPITSFSPGDFEPLDPVFFEQTNSFDDAMNGSYSFMYFSDRLFNRPANAVDFAFSPCFVNLSGWKGDATDLECGFTFTLYSISESYYKWLAFCDQAGGIVFSDFGDYGLADPIWGYSNVSTGAGVVAAQSSTTVTLNLQDFLENTLSGTP